MRSRIARRNFLTTLELAIGQGILFDEEVCRVASTSKNDHDGSWDVRLERDMDEDRVVNVAFTNLQEPLWAPLASKQCIGHRHVEWLAWGFEQAEGPFICLGH